jgi:tetratricopeptide (TPR) repeat protein
MRLCGTPRFLLALAVLSIALPLTSYAQSNAPAMQLPADQKAYRAALDKPDPDSQIAALQAFLHDFPDSKRDGPARMKIFRLLLGVRPDRVKEIDALAVIIIHNSGTGLALANEENEVAYFLAEALPNGVDLDSAEKWAKDSVAQSTLTVFTAQARQASEQSKEPMPSAAELQHGVDELQVAELQTLADVYFHEGKLDKATATLDQTKGLDPKAVADAFGSIQLTRGQIAYAQHRDAEALDDLELAEIYGGLNAQMKPVLLKLYAQAHGGSTAGMDAEIDARYRKLLPAAFTPKPHTAPPTGRTVLLELYTGSACEPCVAADLVLDGVLEAYPRSEVVALSFDQHIPEPDPLANPDTVARADSYRIGGTPNAFIDGQSAGFVGGYRDYSQQRFTELIPVLDKELNVPSGLVLKLNASVSPDHTIVANATAEITDSAALHKLLASGTAPNLVLNIALVQPEVRYSGENGIRFHSMVVRALARPTAKGFPVAMTGESHASFTFDPATISTQLSKYLADFSQHNDRWGVVQFLSTDTTLNGPLAVAAWVEEPATHKVVQAAFFPLSAPAQEATR